ncbi:MAG: hypothetical protein ACRDY1_16575, partial [Acidimicrobiales bacterium]
MSDERLTSGTVRTPRRMMGRALTVVLSSVVVVAFSATAASARPTPANPPAPTGTVTTSASGATTVTASGSWSWAVGTGAGQLNATNGSTKQKCGGQYGVGWGIAWNDPTDAGYAVSYKHKGTVYTVHVGSTTGPDANLVGYNTGDPCGTYSASAVTGTWTATHTYPAGTALPSEICVVSYVLKQSRPGHKKMYQVYTNKN